MGISLYELTEQYNYIMEMLYDDDTDLEMVFDVCASIEDGIEEKAENYAKIIKSLDASAEAIGGEIARLTARKKTLDLKSKYMKESLETAMRATGKTKFRTPMFSFGIQKNPPSAEIIDTEKFIEWASRNRDEFLRYAKPDIDKKAVLEALKDGEVIEGATLKQSESLRIR